MPDAALNPASAPEASATAPVEAPPSSPTVKVVLRVLRDLEGLGLEDTLLSISANACDGSPWQCHTHTRQSVAYITLTFTFTIGGQSCSYLAGRTLPAAEQRGTPHTALPLHALFHTKEDALEELTED